MCLKLVFTICNLESWNEHVHKTFEKEENCKVGLKHIKEFKVKSYLIWEKFNKIKVKPSSWRICLALESPESPFIVIILS